MSADFSTTENPNGVWSYNQGGAPITQAVALWGLEGWSYYPGPVGTMDSSITKATGTLNPGWHDLQTGDVAMHAASSGGGEVSITWTSPAAGTINLSGSAWDAYFDPDRDALWQLKVGRIVVAQRDTIRGLFRTDDAASFEYNLVAGQTLTGLHVGACIVVEFVATKTPASPAGHFMGVDMTVDFTPMPAPAQDARDWGDAPPPYPTLGGASHVITGDLYLGVWLDEEADGQVTPQGDATDDDVAGLADDEDGVQFNTALIASVPATVNVTVTKCDNTPAYLQGWIDFNADGDWDDAYEPIIQNYPVINGVNTIEFPVPVDLVPGPTYARFRLSSQLDLDHTAPATDGEVEDYRVFLHDQNSLKWLQPPDLTRAGVDVGCTWFSLADDFKCTQTGPITDIHLWGSYNQDELPAGGPGSLAITLFICADVPADPADPDSYSHPGNIIWEKAFVPGQFTAGLCSHVNDGEWFYEPLFLSWSFPGDFNCYQFDFHIDPAEAFQQGRGRTYWLGVLHPHTSVMFGWKTSSRHWNDDACIPTTYGWRPLVYESPHPYAPDSIDMAFALAGPPLDRVDCGDLPDPIYPTLLDHSGPWHVIVDTLRLGKEVDADDGMQEGGGADADDLNGTTPDDEDGVADASLTGLIRGQLATVPVSVFNNTGEEATLWGWIDFNGNGSVEGGEGQTANVGTSANPQTINLYYGVPENAKDKTYARFRLGTVAAQVTSPMDGARDGEVEDYPVTTVPPPPTAARLANFRAVWTGLARVQLSWGTLVEFNLLGFYVDRTTGDGSWQRVPAQLIPAAGRNHQPQTYGLVDDPVPIATVLTYRVVEVDLFGLEHVLAQTTLPAAITTTIARTRRGLNLTLRAAPNSIAVIETAAKVTGPWTPLEMLTLDADGIGSLILDAPSDEPKRFYRAESE